MWTLALECSTGRGSLALAQDGAPRWQAAFAAGRGRGGEFFAALETAVGAIGGETLGEIVVGLGPGSYSGVRQAIAAATGLALAHGARLSGLPSTVALETDAPAYHALGDARRGAYYYTAVGEGACVVEPALVERAEALARLATRPGWPALAEAPLEGLPVTGGVFPAAARLLTAPAATRRSSPLEPLYLRDPAITRPQPRPRP